MNSQKKIVSLAIIGLMFLLLPFNALFAQGPGPGNPPGTARPGDEAIGGNAPIGGGSIILLALAAVYGGKKIYYLNTNNEDIEE